MSSRHHGPSPFEVDAPAAAAPPPPPQPAVRLSKPAAPLPLAHVTTPEHMNSVLQGAGRDRLVALKFSAEWCGPCKAIQPAFEKALGELGIQGVEVDVDQAPELAKRFNVKAMPTFMFVRNGKVVYALTGANKNAMMNGMSVYAAPQVQCGKCKRAVQDPHHPLKWSNAAQCVARGGCDSCAWPDEEAKEIKCAKCSSLPAAASQQPGRA